MKKSFLTLLSIAIVVMALISTFGVSSLSVSATEYKYYSESNKPVFYGATEITIDKDVVDAFDIKDSRFRVFAKDFEDGDLSHLIVCTSQNVNATEPGDYSVTYEVTDSHNNKTTLTVPVHVLDKSEKECCIVRTLYTLPSMANSVELAGTYRCHSGDRQILGIYMPADSSIEIMPVDMDADLTVGFLTNYGSKESSQNISASSSTYMTFKNQKQVDGETVSYDSVPLLTTKIQGEGQPVDKTYKIKIKFNDSVKALDYYHYKDSEEEFMSDWKNSENSFAIVDGEAIMVIVPFADVDKISNYQLGGSEVPFASLDAFLEYYLEVVNRMDAMIGLSLNPTKATDQNVRVKYFAKPNGDSSGGAYYVSNHIGVCSNSAIALFQYGWGTLHEIAHGYQGTLGRGSSKDVNLCLNETGNNILAHYIQIDRNLYLKSDDWMGGSLATIEESRNQKRLSGEAIFNNDGGTYTNVQEKLYAIVNLLDSFEGTTTYAKMFSAYRSLIKEKGNNYYTIPEFYAIFFAEEYKVNIVPYLEQWTMSLSAEIKQEILSKKLPAMSILADAVSEDTLAIIQESEGLSCKYSLVKDDLLQQYNVTSNLDITIDIDNLNDILNKNILILREGEVVKTIKITSKNIRVEGLPTGTYEIKFPVNFDYVWELCSVTLKEGDNSLSYAYTKIDNEAYLPVSINIRGIYGTTGYNLDLTNKNKTGNVTLSGADLGNRNDTWSSKMDEVFVSVTIFNNNGEEVDKLEVRGNQYFSDLTLVNPTINFEYGYRVQIYTNKPEFVRVLETATKNVLSQYACADATITYEVTEEGLKLLNNESLDPAEVTYGVLKEKYLAILDEYKNNVTDEELLNKNTNSVKKIEVVDAYNKLREEDRTEYVELINKIKRGGSPVITAPETIKVKQSKDIKNLDDVDLYSLITVTDNEDYVIDSSTIEVQSGVDRSIPGTYSIKLVAKDSDGNTTSKLVEVSVEEDEEGAVSKKVIYILVGVFIVLLITWVTCAVVKNSRDKKKKSHK